MAGFDFVKAADAFGEPVETACPRSGVMRTSDDRTRTLPQILVGEVQPGADTASRISLLFQVGQFALHVGFGHLEDFQAICAVFRLPPSSNNLTIGFMGREGFAPFRM